METHPCQRAWRTTQSTSVLQTMQGGSCRDHLVERLPEALKSAFVEVEAEYFRSPARVRLSQQGGG